jgi:hypothetical protein
MRWALRRPDAAPHVVAGRVHPGFALGLPFCVLNWYSTSLLARLPDTRGLVNTISSAPGVVPLGGFILFLLRSYWWLKRSSMDPLNGFGARSRMGR